MGSVLKKSWISWPCLLAPTTQGAYLTIFVRNGLCFEEKLDQLGISASTYHPRFLFSHKVCYGLCFEEMLDQLAVSASTNHPGFLFICTSVMGSVLRKAR